MENDRQKWVSLSFVVFSGIVGFVLFTFLSQISQAYDLEARYQQMVWVVRGVALVVGLGLFIGFYRSDAANQFMNEVIVELGRVSWPTRQETTKGTIVVVIFCIICGLILGALDTLWAWAMSFVV